MEIITVNGLSKIFGRSVVLDDISFSVSKGSIFGLLGPNGAGKTTLISILTTLLRPTKGNAMICGFDLVRSPNEIRKRIGVVFQESVIDSDLSPFDNLDIHARLYKLPRGERKERIDYLLKLVSLEDRKDEPIKKFSSGMQRRVEIARGLLNEPEVLFLDEPTLGLDPDARRKIWGHILKINQKGITVIVSTNYMEEVHALCSEIAIMNKGKIVVIGKKQELLDKVNEDVINIELFLDIEKAVKSLKKVFPNVTKTESGISIRVKAAENKIQKLVSILNKSKIDIERIKVIKPNLEDVFLKYTGEELK